MALQVVHWGTGNTGVHGLRALIQHPDLNLVGVVVHSPDKAGRDAGDLCGLPPTGVIATADVPAAVALQADCMSYMANGLGREAAAVADVVPFLEAGTDVVTCSLIPLLHPPSAPADLRSPLVAACDRGGSSMFNSGIDPGYATSQLAASVLSIASEVECVRVQELGNFSRYGAADVMRNVFGFGQPGSYLPPLFTSGMLGHFWNGTLHELAALQRLSLDRIELRHDVALTDHAVDTAFGRVDAGTIGAVRFELVGIAGDAEVAVVEHVDRIDPHVAPQWSRATGTEATAYRVIVTGIPNISCELDFDFARNVSGAVVATATFLVNSIPTVVTSRAGLLSMADVKPFVGRRLPPPRPRPNFE